MQFMKSHFHQYYNNLEKISKLATSSAVDHGDLRRGGDGGEQA
jgi:hypothetical protein